MRGLPEVYEVLSWPRPLRVRLRAGHEEAGLWPGTRPPGADLGAAGGLIRLREKQPTITSQLFVHKAQKEVSVQHTTQIKVQINGIISDWIK